MRLQHVLQSRPDWYDRNPVSLIRSFYVPALPPHAATTRWTYTVPAGKKFAVQTIQLNLIRDGATATPAVATINAALTPAAGGGDVALLVESPLGTLGAADQCTLGTTMVMAAGDALSGTSADASTGGTFSIMCAMTGLQFDA